MFTNLIEVGLVVIPIVVVSIVVIVMVKTISCIVQICIKIIESLKVLSKIFKGFNMEISTIFADVHQCVPFGMIEEKDLDLFGVEVSDLTQQQS